MAVLPQQRGSHQRLLGLKAAFGKVDAQGLRLLWGDVGWWGRLSLHHSSEVYGDMHRYIPYLAKNAGFTKIGEKVVHHQARKYGKTKFGLDRFVNGYLDLATLWFTNKFGIKPMHFFGLLGSLMFMLGLIAVVIVGAMKLWHLSNGTFFPRITDTPYFYLALVTMILGTQLFLTGFLGELIVRNSSLRNNYEIEEEINIAKK